MWIDAHSHMSFLGAAQIGKYLEQGKAAGLGQWILGGYGPSDWQTQREIADLFPDKFVTCFGVHPWYLREAYINNKDLEALKVELEVYSESCDFIGETGIDMFRPNQSAPLDVQKDILHFHLVLAQAVNKPLVLHVVSAHGEVLDMLSTFPGKHRGFIHGFSGSVEVARRYLEMGFLISVGPSVLKNNFKKLRETVKALPLEALVIESDSPKDDEDLQTNPVENFFIAAGEVALLKNIDQMEVLEASSRNLRCLMVDSSQD